MKVKLKNKGVKLPNIWKQCKVSYEDWQELHDGKEIEMKSVPEGIKTLVNVSGTKKKGDK
tara:strand:- start:2679 stop:2858 length:180 start_codon:yes stop_codon:yes gene_type:complete